MPTSLRNCLYKWTRVPLLFGLMVCAVFCHAEPISVEHACAPKPQFNQFQPPEHGWSPGTGTIFLNAPCWLRISQSLEKSKLLSIKTIWIDVSLYDLQGKILGRAIHAGEQSNAIVSANRISFITEGAAFPLYIKLEVSPTTSFYDQIEVESLDLNEVNRSAQSFDSISIAQASVLLGFALITMTFGVLLRDLTYLLFSLFAFFQAAFLVFNNGLIFSLWNVPPWLPSLFLFTSWPASALQSLIVTRMAGFSKHSPNLHRVMLLIALLYFCLIPLDQYFHSAAMNLQDYLGLVWYPLALFGVIRAITLRRRGSAILFLGLLPIASFWWPHAVANLLPISWGLNREIPTGSALEIIQNLFFPALFCLGIAYRSLLLHREAIRIARSDKLTGLLNRERLAHRGDSIIGAKNKQSIAVAALNIDRFKAINETLGYDIGDATLVAVGHRLASIPMTIVGRSQSDQFFTIWFDAEKIELFRRHIQELFFAPIVVSQQIIDVSLSVGITSQSGVSMRLQMRCAEIALNVARNEKTGWEVYRPEMETAKLGDLHLLSELRTAISENQLRLYLQPKVRLSDGAVTSAEALVRWQHPERGMIPPYQFIPFAENTGNISAITEWMLSQAMQCTASWRNEGHPIQISVNLSAFDLRNHRIVSVMETLRDAHGASTADIRLEVTESSVMNNPETSIQVLHALHAHGYSIAIDDFGTGYSSLAYLQKMPVTELKIDRVFVAGVTADTDAATLLLSTIELGQRLKLSIVAEGVEAAQEWILLKSFGCDYIQGWFAAKAMPASDFLLWANNNTPFIFPRTITANSSSNQTQENRFKEIK